MKVIDLTHVVERDISVFPGSEHPSFETVNTYDKDGYKQTKFTLLTHAGTHMDPPAHVCEGKTTLDQFSPEQFIGKGLVIDCSSLDEGDAITMENLAPYKEKAEQADFLLFYTGWDKRWKTDTYLNDYPCIDEEVTQFILEGDFKGTGFDVIGIDPATDANLTRHKKLFNNKDLVIIENLCNLGECGSDLFWFSCFPLKIKDADGAPIRAVAWFE